MTIELTRLNPGTATSASSMNTAFTTLANATGALDTTAIDNNAVTRDHMVADSVLLFAGNSINVSTTGSYNSTSYTLVSHGTDMDVPVNIAIEAGQVVRCHATIFTTTGTQDGTDTDACEFKFKFYWDIGAGYVPMDDMVYRYSYAVRDETSIGSISVYKNRRVGFSLLYIHSGADVTPVSIQCRIALGNTANSITLKQTVLNVLVLQP